MHNNFGKWIYLITKILSIKIAVPNFFFETFFFNEDEMFPIWFPNLTPDPIERCMRLLDYPTSILLQLLIHNYLLHLIYMPNPIEQMNQIHWLTTERFLLQTEILNYWDHMIIHIFLRRFEKFQSYNQSSVEDFQAMMVGQSQVHRRTSIRKDIFVPLILSHNQCWRDLHKCPVCQQTRLPHLEFSS